MHTAIIIDDSKTSRSVLRTILEKNGYEIVAEAANGEEGFEKYCEEANTGDGIKISKKLRPYFQFILPILIVFILIQGLI
mgnify:CR=1 FL=1